MIIEVKLNLLGTLAVRSSELSIAVPAGATVGTLVDLIDKANPGFKAALTSNKGDLSPQFAIFINGRNAAHLDDIRTTLAAGDAVNVIPTIAGG